MGFAAAVVAGLALWLILWATGAKAFDAFLPAVVIVLVTATVRAVARRLQRPEV